MGGDNRGFDSKKIKQIREIILFSAIIILVVMYGAKLGKLALLFVDITMPFIVGAAIAFMINIPMKAIENKLLGKWKGKAADKFKRVVSMLLAIVLVLGIVAIVIVTVLPQLISTVKEIIILVPEAFNRAYNWVLKTFQDNPKIMKYLKEIDPKSIDWTGMLSGVVDFVKNQFGNVLSGAASIIGSIANGFYNFLKKTVKLLSVNFHNFITGQCLEASILGLMFVVVMTILKLPYPVLAGVLIGFTALIPIAGAFIGCAICALLILMVSPVKMLAFIITFLVLQQIEGNFIYPRVVGGSVGLPSLWVLMAVSVGGSLMGVIGMLIFIPIFSTIYMLLREDVNKRNAVKAGNAIKIIDISDKEEVAKNPVDEANEEKVDAEIEKTTEK
jgi:predicted PurR-regulated permease PerM